MFPFSQLYRITGELYCLVEISYVTAVVVTGTEVICEVNLPRGVILLTPLCQVNSSPRELDGFFNKFDGSRSIKLAVKHHCQVTQITGVDSLTFWHQS